MNATQGREVGNQRGIAWGGWLNAARCTRIEFGQCNFGFSFFLFKPPLPLTLLIAATARLSDASSFAPVSVIRTSPVSVSAFGHTGQGHHPVDVTRLSGSEPEGLLDPGTAGRRKLSRSKRLERKKLTV